MVRTQVFLAAVLLMLVIPIGPEEGRTQRLMKSGLLADSDTVLEGQELQLEGNVVVSNGATLTMIDSTIEIEPKEDGDIGISVERGASLVIRNSTIRSLNGHGYTFRSYGNVTIEGSDISHIWGDKGNMNGIGGLEVHGAQLKMEDSSVRDCTTNCIFSNHSEVELVRVTLSGSADDGIELNDSSAIVIDSDIGHCGWGLVGFFSKVITRGSTYHHNTDLNAAGISTKHSSLEIMDCSVHNNSKYGLKMDFSKLSMETSDICDNDDVDDSKGIFLFHCTGTIEHNRVLRNGYSGLYLRNTTGTTISYNTIGESRFSNGRGIRLICADVVIENNVIFGNNRTGIFSNHSFFTIRNNVIMDNTGSTVSGGIYTNHDRGTIVNNEILRSGTYGLGIENSNMEISGNRVTDNDRMVGIQERVGIYLWGSECVVSGNYINNKDTAFASDHSQLVLDDNIINGSDIGAALDNATNARLENNTITGARVFDIRVISSDAVINDCTAVSIYCKRSSPSFTGCTFDSISGLDHVFPRIVNCTFKKLSFNTDCKAKVFDPVKWPAVVSLSARSEIEVLFPLTVTVKGPNGTPVTDANVTIMAAKGVNLSLQQGSPTGTYGPFLLTGERHIAPDPGSSRSTIERPVYLIGASHPEKGFAQKFTNLSSSTGITLVLDNISAVWPEDVKEDPIPTLPLRIVRYSPKTTINMYEDETLLFWVLVQANEAHDLQFRWFIDGSQLANTDGPTLLLLGETYSLIERPVNVTVLIICGDERVTMSWYVSIFPVGLYWDLDDDLMTDDWEMRYFGNLNHDADDDYDNDGHINLQEFESGTDPTDPDDPPDDKGGVSLFLIFGIALFNWLVILILLAVLVYLVLKKRSRNEGAP